MRDVSNDYIAQVKSGARQFGFYVRVYGNGPEPETLWLADIISVDITRSISDQLQIGACMSDRLTLQTKATTLFGGKGKKVEVFYRCTAPILDWVRLGTFYVDECVTDQGVTAVTAYDMMSRLDKRVSWGATSRVEALTFPCTMQDMLDYICARAGVTTDFSCQDITVEKTPDGYTARELISYIAASHGANARFSPSEVLQIRTYTQTSEVIQYGSCYSMNIASDGGFTVKGLLFDRGGDDMIYIDGSASEYDEDADGVVEAYNPFATVGIAEYAWSKLGGLSYSSVSLEMPAQNILEPGDEFTVQGADGTEKTAVVMEQTLSASCTGGFVEKISCTAESKNQTRNAENRAEAAEREVQNYSGGVLTEYEYLSDLSVKCNGATYTIEKDSATGLIVKITDNAGNEFKPKINSGITNTALHNAVFWAVAMAKGIGNTFDYFDVYWDYNQTLILPDYPITAIGVDNMPGGTGVLIRLKSFSFLAGCILSNVSRGNFGLCLVVSGDHKWYTGTYPKEPDKKGSSSQFWLYLKNKKREFYFSSSPTSAHPAFSGRIKVSEKFKIDPPDFKEIFNLPMSNITDVMIYKAGNYFLECFFNGEKFILDKTNSRGDFGTGSYYADLNAYCPVTEGDFKYAYGSVKTLDLVKDSQYIYNQYAAILNDLDGSIFFNTFDVCDEKGNVLLPKNCDLDFFIGG